MTSGKTSGAGKKAQTHGTSERRATRAMQRLRHSFRYNPEPLYHIVILYALAHVDMGLGYICEASLLRADLWA